MKGIPNLVLPGITKNEMILVDKIMIEYGISLELMMENAGLNLARRVNNYLFERDLENRILVVAGSGGNGGGGIVAARRLAAWGYSVEVYIPKGFSKLQPVPFIQMNRAKKFGVLFHEGVPSNSQEFSLIIDSYIGYSYESRSDDITDSIFTFFNVNTNIISLDCPSGMNVTTGEISSNFDPVTTVTLAFVKKGLLLADPVRIGDLYVADIGVPIEVFLSSINLEWKHPYKIQELKKLYSSFANDSLQKIERFFLPELDKLGWKVKL
ncbi:MAG: NAD(P)H-hydrate epimerase [Candidatus Hodarchaeales archaeon]|jgi:NAD(P)H-hydrate epimerase